MFKLLLAVALLATACSASIEKEPVKVTHHNSGPRYELDDVGRISLAEGEASNNVDSGSAQDIPKPFRQGAPWPRPIAVDSPNHRLAPPLPAQEQPHQPQLSPLAPSPPQAGDGDQPMGVSIRRVFLFPIMAPPSMEEEPNHPSMMSPVDRDAGPNLLLRIIASHPPPERHHHPHLLGQDEASRGPMRRGEVEGENPASMAASASGERGDVISPLERQFNPLQMMIEMMRHAMNTDPMADQQPNPFFTDLNKDASSRPDGEDGDKVGPEGTSLGRPVKPQTKNETKEEIVEIEGRKYLRKSIITKHVGDNMMFMSRRLIFVPLNETDAGDVSTTTTTVAPDTPSTTIAAEGSDKEPKVVAHTTKPEESSPSTTTSTTTTAAPTTVETTSSPTSSESTTKAAVEESTTTTASSNSPSKEPTTERVPDMEDNKRSSDRLTESVTAIPK